MTEVTKLANISQPSSLGQATTVDTNRVIFGLNNPTYPGGTLRYIGSAPSTCDREVVVWGTATIEASGTAPAATLTLTGPANATDPYTLTLGGSNTGDNIYQGAIGGALSVVKNGRGKVDPLRH